MEGMDGLESETTFPEGFTRALLFFGPPSSRAFLLTPKTPVDVHLLCGACLTLAPPRGVMVHPVDSMLRPLFCGGGTIANGAMVNAFISYLTKLFSCIAWLASDGMPSRLKVEQEPVYKARAWASMSVLERGEEK